VAPNVYTGQGATVGRDGRLYFATSSGIAVIDPRRIRRVTTPPVVLIEQVVVDRVEPLRALRVAGAHVVAAAVGVAVERCAHVSGYRSSVMVSS